DCASTNAGAYAVPPEVTGVAFTNRTTLSWDPAQLGAGSGTVADVLRGSADMRVGTGAEACLASGITGNSVVDATTPAPGTAFRYLVRGRNVCGLGTYGMASDGTPRTSMACP
ncbi:MAG: hypothetical protein DMF49_03180, partial [Acidobacteria bacterium]